MCQRFGRVIPQPGGDRNPHVTVDHKGVVRVVDDARKFHLQNSIELLDDWTDFKFVSPYHRGSPSSWRPGTGRRYDCANAWPLTRSATAMSLTGRDASAVPRGF